MQVLTHTNQLCYGALWQKKAYKHLPNRYFIWNNTDSSIKVGYSWTIYKIIIPNTPKDILKSRYGHCFKRRMNTILFI
ncbi:hypothetical protein [Blautia hansenii]|uniref:hypothetical protein n=1 Tax=Blautia hansenii TaxID=1322 RepID=UPI003BAC78AA